MSTDETELSDATHVRTDATHAHPLDPDATRKLDNPRQARADASGDPVVGRQLLDRYLVVRKIGSGGFGSVYQAEDQLKKKGGEQHNLAIKTLDLNVSTDRLSGLIQEVSRAHVVSHPNILRVYDIHVDGALAFITMELLVGESLEERLESGEPLTTAEVDRIAECMCGALSYCHQQNLIHSDMKPANVFLCEDGSIKLLDLGIAQIVGSANQIAGYSPRYASPEQASGEPPDPRDDLFSLACVLYESLTCRHPFDTQTPAEAKAAGAKPDLAILPQRYRAALAAGLAYAREDRPASVQRLWSRISPAVRKRYLIAAALAVIAAVGFVASNQIGEQVGKAAISVSPEHAAQAEALYEDARRWIETKEGDPRSALVEALRHNPYLEPAAELLVDQVRRASPNDPSQFGMAWSDFAAALAASPNSEALTEFATETTDSMSSRDPARMSRIEVLSQLRAPVCALQTTGYRAEELAALRSAASINC